MNQQQPPQIPNPEQILTGTVRNLLQGIESALGIVPGTSELLMPKVENYARQIFGGEKKGS